MVRSAMFGFSNLKELVDRNIVQYLMLTRGPEYFYLRGLRSTQTKVYPFIVSRLVASRRRCESSLPVSQHAGTQAVAITARAPECNRKPMAGAGPIHKDLRATTKDGSHNIDRSVVVEIAKCRAPCGHQRVSPWIHQFEASVLIHCNQCGL